MEVIDGFVARFAAMVGCYHHKCNSGIYSLKKNDTLVKGRMGVFAWIRKLKRRDIFEISTYKILGDKCNVSHLADEIVPGMHFVSKRKDTGEGTGLVFFVHNCSTGPDYVRTVKAIRAIRLIK
jgi:hypothetical protein